MSKTQLYSRGANGLTFADPTDPNYTMRFKSTQSRKNLNGQQVVNFVEDIIVNDLVPVTLGTGSANDSVSVRLRVSGSAESHARVKAIVKSLAAQLPAWADSNVLLGFEPSEAPDTPTA